MENCHRSGGNQRGKHHLRAFTRRESSLPAAAPLATLIYPKPTEPPSGMLRCRDSQLRRGPRATRYPKATRQNQCCIPVQHPESPLRIRSGADHPDPPRATQPPDGRSATRAIPTLMGGAGAPDTRKLLVNIHPALQCSISGTRLKWPRRTGALLEQKQTGTPCRGWSAPGAFSVCSSKR